MRCASASTEAKHELLMILDADLTAPPEDLHKFYLAVAEGRADLANGSRLVYDLEPGAMQFLTCSATSSSRPSSACSSSSR